MALFKLGGGKDAHAASQNPPPGVPTDMVIQMRRQGISNNQVIQSLQRMGYRSHEIFDAMNQADIKGGVEGAMLDQIDPSMDVSQYPQTQQMPQQQSQQFQSSQQFQQQSQSRSDDPTYKIEEIAEAIIDEKWEEMLENLKKIAEWKATTETRLSAMEQEIKDLKEAYKDLHSGVLGKVKEYDKNITDVGTEIKAMSKVFEKITPVLSQNVNDLSRIAETMKKSQK